MQGVRDVRPTEPCRKNLDDDIVIILNYFYVSVALVHEIANRVGIVGQDDKSGGKGFERVRAR